MKILKIAFFALMLGTFALAQNQQSYRFDKAQCEKYIKLSREQIDKGNLGLARAYAQKAIQANAWNKLAWAAYDDSIQRLADEGSIEEYGTILEESKASQNAPKPSSGAAQFEGC